jgi:hypothetical protein
MLSEVIKCDDILDSNLYDKRNRLNVKAAVYLQLICCWTLSIVLSGWIMSSNILIVTVYHRHKLLDLVCCVFAVSVLISSLTQRRQSSFYFRPEILYGVNFGTVVSPRIN